MLMFTLSLSLSLSLLPPVSLDLLAADVRLISQGMKQTLAEFLQNKSNKALKKFCFEAEPLATKLEADLVTAKEAFGEVVQYFGYVCVVQVSVREHSSSSLLELLSHTTICFIKAPT